MTTLERGLSSPQDEPRASSSQVSTTPDDPSNRGRRSSRGLEQRLSNVIDLEDPTRIVECSQLERQRKFQYLVRCYLSQILYGCKSAYCDTPTCLSCNKRGASKPYRPPTQLTARALAHYLAGQSNPHRGLCPHELKVPPASLQVDGAVDMSVGYGDGSNKTPTRLNHPSNVQLDVLRAINERHQKKKDRKSLGQNLYDSVSLIHSYSKVIPSSLLALNELRDLEGGIQQNKRTSGANDPTVTACANGAASVTLQSSQQDPRVQGQAHAARDHHEMLSNGQQVHKVPYHRPAATGQSHTVRLTSATPPESTTVTPKMSILKTGRKSFTLGGAIVPPMVRAKAPSASAPPTQIVAKPGDARGIVPAASSLSCSVLDQLKDEVHHRRQENDSAFNSAVEYDASRRIQPVKAFVNRSLFYTLSDPETLLQSFRDSNEAFQDSPLPHLDSARLAHSFRDWNQRNGALIFDSLSLVVEALFTRPPALDTPNPSNRKSAPNGDPKESTADKPESPIVNPRYLSNHEAAHIVMICIHALTSLVPVGWPRSWAQLRSLRSWGVVAPNATSNADDFLDPYMNIIDALEYEPAVRLADRLLRGIGARTCFEHILVALHEDAKAPLKPNSTTLEDGLMTLLVKHLEVVERVALDNKRKMKSINIANKEPGWTVTATFMEWLKTIIIKKWDGKLEVNKWSNVGTAVMLLHEFHDRQYQLNVWSRMFKVPYLNEHIDSVDDPVEFLEWRSQPNALHLLQYPELHPTEYLVRHFRTIHLTSMVAQYDHTQHIQQMLRTLDMILREPYLYMIKHRLKVTLNDYLVLDVSRQAPLKDTLDQLWRQERKMLLKPLKVKLGQEEGEVGLDHGGVTYEFFRVILSEAFAPEYGMFTVDPTTHMTWFQPGSLEPLWKFKMLGVLFSLAIYNGITLPVTFPTAFYNLMLNSRFKFLDDHTSIDYIRDGWPDLAKGFHNLLEWTDGDVADVFVRDYVFSYEAFGQRHNVDMTESNTVDPSSTVPYSSVQEHHEAPLVTNENRGAFVRDYVMHLILHSIRPQLKAFKRGFMACLNPRSLELFTPKILKKIVEGTQTISITELRQCARYENYSATHPTIKLFWDVVQEYKQEDARHLLEFVTASDRVPVTGYKSLAFNIVRFGEDSEQLPTSSTCFGKLYLPEYKVKEKMKRKLELAIQNAKGFGVV